MCFKRWISQTHYFWQSALIQLEGKWKVTSVAYEIHNQDHTERNFRLKMTPAYVLCSQIRFFLHKLDVTVTILVMDVSALCSSWGQNRHSQKWEKPQCFKENTWLMYNKWTFFLKMWWKSKTKQNKEMSAWTRCKLASHSKLCWIKMKLRPSPEIPGWWSGWAAWVWRLLSALLHPPHALW